MNKLIKFEKAIIAADRVVSMQIDPYFSSNITIRLTQDKQPLTIKFKEEIDALAALASAYEQWKQFVK